MHINHNAISYSCSNIWYRPLTVDSYDGSFEKAIRVGSDPCDVEIIGDGSCISEAAKAEHENG